MHHLLLIAVLRMYIHAHIHRYTWRRPDPTEAHTHACIHAHIHTVHRPDPTEARASDTQRLVCDLRWGCARLVDEAWARRVGPLQDLSRRQLRLECGHGVVVSSRTDGYTTSLVPPASDGELLERGAAPGVVRHLQQCLKAAHWAVHQLGPGHPRFGVTGVRASPIWYEADGDVTTT